MILLTFNILKNLPETKNGKLLDSRLLTEISVENAHSLLRLLGSFDVKCTFFVETSLVPELKFLVKEIISDGHEIAIFNDGSDSAMVADAKSHLEEITGKTLRGIRRKNPKLTVNEISNLGFSYISDIENTNILFPFKRLKRGTEITEEAGVSLIPESISPYSQIPYNDFAFQIVPLKYYCNMVEETIKNEEFVIIYLNASQFTDAEKYGLKLPFYRRYNSGRKLEDKLTNFLEWISENSFATSTVKDFLF